MLDNFHPKTGIKITSSLGIFFAKDWNYLVDALVDSIQVQDDYNLEVFHNGYLVFSEEQWPGEGKAIGLDDDYLKHCFEEISKARLLSPRFLQDFSERNNLTYGFPDSQNKLNTKVVPFTTAF